MGAKRAYRNRTDSEVAVLDALIERPEGGMTVLELRTRADVGIDELETALGNLKDANLITVEKNGDRTVILPDESVIPDRETEEPSIIDRVRDRLPF
ncbi:MAG: MarR family transcriptional regulator [Euryarchaeota archaeon]|jgi:predicted transcriptional regulator|nr:MarR family transcriptional regulator [Euryarchaeota archaeon]